MPGSNRRNPTESQWAAIRALSEGAMPTRTRLAAAIGVGLPAISRRATREGWTSLDFRRLATRRMHETSIATRMGRG